MSAPTKPTKKSEKKKRFQRATEKQYRWVKFTHELFGDEAFELPAMSQLNLGLIESLNNGDMGQLARWLSDVNVDEDMIDAIRSLDQEEFSDFQKSWAEGIDIPKSSD